jgi:hypothetical protein
MLKYLVFYKGGPDHRISKINAHTSATVPLAT